MFNRLAVGTVKGGEGLMALVLDYLQRQNIQCITVDDGKGEDGGTDEIMIPAAVAEKVAGGAADGGIIIDSWGIGGSVTVNKFRGVRGSRCTSATTARYTRRHNDSNILCLGYKPLGAYLCLDIVKAWVNSEFEGGRHAISVNLIRSGEEHQFKGADILSSLGESGNVRALRGHIERVYIANDHAGFEAKGRVTGILRERKIDVVDLGTESTEIVRYPYYAARAAQKVKESPGCGAVLICGTGIGMSIAANKFKGVRAALCTGESGARYAREHLDSNILCIGGKIIGQFELEDTVNTWLDTRFRENLGPVLAALNEIEDCNLQETGWKPANNI
ncbi:MAG: RpiB/LacA/LacB family sugar-phosphate isomerase [Clostridium sp.]|nr:RpiB/LacA/LacB family sugar-phosphate isomerase [Clostridium sp.]